MLPQLLRWQKWMGSSVYCAVCAGGSWSLLFRPETRRSLGFLFAHNTPILYTSFEQLCRNAKKSAGKNIFLTENFSGFMIFKVKPISRETISKS